VVRVLGVYQARLWFSNWNGDFPLTVALLFGHTVMAEWLLCNFPGVVRLVPPSKFRKFQWAETLLLIAYDATVETPPIYPATGQFDNANLPWPSLWADCQLSVSHVVTCLAAQRVYSERPRTFPASLCSLHHPLLRAFGRRRNLDVVSESGPWRWPGRQPRGSGSVHRRSPWQSAGAAGSVFSVNIAVKYIWIDHRVFFAFSFSVLFLLRGDGNSFPPNSSRFLWFISVPFLLGLYRYLLCYVSSLTLLL
jgi:hypothetical protein